MLCIPISRHSMRGTEAISCTANPAVITLLESARSCHARGFSSSNPHWVSLDHHTSASLRRRPENSKCELLQLRSIRGSCRISCTYIWEHSHGIVSKKVSQVLIDVLGCVCVSCKCWNKSATNFVLVLQLSSYKSSSREMMLLTHSSKLSNISCFFAFFGCCLQ